MSRVSYTPILLHVFLQVKIFIIIVSLLFVLPSLSQLTYKNPSGSKLSKESLFGKSREILNL